MELFTLEAKLKLDTSDYETKIRDIMEQAKKDGASLDAALNVGGGSGTGSGTRKTTGTKSGKKGKASTPIGGTAREIILADWVKKGANYIFGTAKDAVETASSLREIQNVVDQTYGSGAEVINQWAIGAASNYGLSELQAKSFAGYMGSSLQASKFSQSESAEMAMNLAELAGDMASFYNIGIEEAYEKIRSGLSGNSPEPLQGLGINLSVANLEEFSGKDFDKLTDKEKIQTRYDYLLNVTKTAQGDYLRTQDEFANSSRTLANNLEALSAKFGEKLLPLMTGATNAANSFFDALYSKSAEESLESIDQTAESTAQSIGSTADTARAMVDVLEDYGDRSALTAQQQEQWDHVANSLLSTIPELSQVLNMQTGEIIGGTSALDEHITAWEEAGKVAADTSALEAKKGYLSDLSKNIATEQAELAIAEKALSAAQTEMIAKAQEAATVTGEAFDGTADGALSMLRKGVDYYEMFGVKDIESIVESYEEADEAVKTHQLELSTLKEDYTTVEESIEADTALLSETVGTMEEAVTGSFEAVGTSMDTLVSDLNQGDTAYANAYNTGVSAALGLSDAYPAWAEAMSMYNFTPPSYEEPDYGPIEEGDTIGGQIGTAVSSALNGAAVVMDGEKVGNLVTGTVSRNIERKAWSERFA